MDPDPRGTGLLKAEPASSHSLPALCADGSQGAEGRTCDGGAGLCGKNSGLAPAGPVSTALTSTGTTSVRPAGIVGILRFLFGVRRRRACDVSTVDTTTRQASPLSPPLASWTNSLPRISARASVSEVMTLNYLRRIIHGTSRRWHLHRSLHLRRTL